MNYFKNDFIMILSIMTLIAIGAYLYVNREQYFSKSSKTTQNQENIKDAHDYDVIYSFFKLIDDDQISEAIMLMNPKISKDETLKQSWEKQLNAFESVTLKSVEASGQEEWRENRHKYMVIFNAEMKAEAANESIPYFGYESDDNTRWIAIEKINDKWYINGIATGP